MVRRTAGAARETISGFVKDAAKDGVRPFLVPAMTAATMAAVTWFSTQSLAALVLAPLLTAILTCLLLLALHLRRREQERTKIRIELRNLGLICAPDEGSPHLRMWPFFAELIVTPPDGRKLSFLADKSHVIIKASPFSDAIHLLLGEIRVDQGPSRAVAHIEQTSLLTFAARLRDQAPWPEPLPERLRAHLYLFDADGVLAPHEAIAVLTLTEDGTMARWAGHGQATASEIESEEA